MPIYEFQCPECGSTMDVTRPHTDASPVFCDVCGTLMRKIISSTSFVLKGDGWYRDGYSKKEE